MKTRVRIFEFFYSIELYNMLVCHIGTILGLMPRKLLDSDPETSDTTRASNILLVY